MKICVVRRACLICHALDGDGLQPARESVYEAKAGSGELR